VLVNLALNARDAMGGRGVLTVVTEAVSVTAEGSEPGRAPGPRMPAGRYVRLSVTDTGHGMDAATRARIFEPFFTTKEAGQGSGLGLATVYGIIKQSDGYIWVYSEPGQGATFTIYLPELAAEEIAEPEAAPAQASPRGSEMILLVDDEPAVRRMAARALEARGYTVLEAGDGLGALDCLRRHPGEVKLVLTDVIMPVLDGGELGERLAAEYPGIPVLFMSGYTDDDAVRRGLLRPGVPFLQKPFEPATLSHKVREVLDA
jgi:CheY-like chemotaxis protein